MFRMMMEALLSRKFNHIDREIGLLRRVGGYWRVENPDIDVSVSVKLEGSDRFGPSRQAIRKYREHRFAIPKMREQLKEKVIAALEGKETNWSVAESVIIMREIIVITDGSIVIADRSADFVFCFNVEQDDHASYTAFAIGDELKFLDISCC